MLGYLGPAGSFSHQAAAEWSEGREELREFRTIRAAIKATHDGETDRCIVPIENSIEGSVNSTLDTLAFEADLYITGEHVLRISQNLMAMPGTRAEDIRVITSHPQALGQCARFIGERFPDAALETADSTSAAADRTAKGETGLACIASPLSAKLYGLEILFPDCGDDRSNSTRFVVLEKKPSLRVTDHDKTSIAFMLEDKPGALYGALELLAKEKINLKKIESRPVKFELGKYIFFIDIDGNTDNADIYFALDRLRRNTTAFKFLGSYHYE